MHRNAANCFLIAGLALCTACASVPDTPRPAPLSSDARGDIGRMAIRGPTKPPLALTSTLDTKGKAAGKTAAAAGLGWLGGTFEAAGQSGDGFGGAAILAFGLVTAPIVALGGAIHGASAADTEEAISAGNAVLHASLDFAPVRFRQVFETALDEDFPVTYTFVDTDKSNAELADLGFDSVLDLRMHVLESRPSDNGYEVRFESQNSVTLTTTVGHRLLESRHYDFQTQDRRVSSWATNGGEVLLAALDQRFGDISHEIVDQFFLAPAIRVQGHEPVSHGFRQTRVDSTTPVFAWLALDGDNATSGEGVTFELTVQTKEDEPHSVRVATTRHTLEEPLRPCTSYRWKVRAHYSSFGSPTVSDWSPTYRFKTPCGKSSG